MKKLTKIDSIAITLLLLALPISVSGKNNLPVSADNLYFYSSSYYPGNIYNTGPVGKVSLSEVADEIIIKKKVDTTKERIEGLVNNLLPTAKISWISENVCTVTADSGAIKSQKSVLLTESDIVSLRPAYIRTIYNDLMELYPVKQVALYGFTDTLFVWQRNENDDDEVDNLIASLGFQFESDPKTPGRLRSHNIFVSKEADILEIANNLFESGYFQYSEPRKRTIVRTIDSDPLDMSQYDYHYNYNGYKTYLYKTPGRFMVKKENDIDKSVIESLIDRYLPEASFVWKTGNICLVDTYESLVDQAIISIRNENSVVCANRCFMKKGDYEYMLLNGTDYPSDFSYDEMIILKFKDNVSASTIDSLKQKYNITSIEEPEGFYFTWAVPKTADYLATCNSLYESGYLSWIDPNWVTGYQIIKHSTDTQTTSIETPLSTKIGESYYDLLGRRIESPSGLTIVVTRYSDGNVRVEKRMYF
jgi:hypothetical protein